MYSQLNVFVTFNICSRIINSWGEHLCLSGVGFVKIFSTKWNLLRAFTTVISGKITNYLSQTVICIRKKGPGVKIKHETHNQRVISRSYFKQHKLSKTYCYETQSWTSTVSKHEHSLQPTGRLPKPNKTWRQYPDCGLTILMVIQEWMRLITSYYFSGPLSCL